ncbi:hypothetical protein [Erythrobacter mangrovi]|uniref:Uncharacterized protein n=1 Tax=Erythrobacter mangrovi TaxID=2739433 RepID=A0A7D3XIR6_9SPHN|nr:hypothetical protein [Erythrobacter mangrovi]QKG72313.1 hypothetical protein HQR01_13590 [Erythrobacter mangrovi]
MAKNFHLPLNQIIEQDESNIVLVRNDVVTALSQPYSARCGRALRKSPLRNLRSHLSQALGQIGGLQHGCANPRGVFLFRWRDWSDPANLRDPVIHNFDFKDPAAYYLTQQFRMDDSDFIYITTVLLRNFSASSGFFRKRSCPQ